MRSPCGSSLRSLDTLVGLALMSRMAHHTLTGVAPAMFQHHLAPGRCEGQHGNPREWFYRRVKVAPGSSHE